MPETFVNGLSAAEDDAIDDIRTALHRVNSQIEALGRHRSYSQAQTKIEEAIHWMRDRKHKPAS